MLPFIFLCLVYGAIVGLICGIFFFFVKIIYRILIERKIKGRKDVTVTLYEELSTRNSEVITVEVKMTEWTFDSLSVSGFMRHAYKDFLNRCWFYIHSDHSKDLEYNPNEPFWFGEPLDTGNDIMDIMTTHNITPKDIKKGW
jgi:hypothetical protein